MHKRTARVPLDYITVSVAGLMLVNAEIKDKMFSFFLPFDQMYFQQIKQLPLITKLIFVNIHLNFAEQTRQFACSDEWDVSTEGN